MGKTYLPVHSMTGFGRATTQANGFRVHVDARSVNGRYLDIRPKYPRALAYLEPKIREWVAEYIKRGVLDLSIVIQSDALLESRIDERAVIAYAKTIKQIAENAEIPSGLSVTSLLKLPGTVLGEDVSIDLDEEIISSLLEECVRSAMRALTKARSDEAGKLTTAVLRELDYLEKERVVLIDDAKNSNEKIATRLRARLEKTELGQRLDEARLLQEVVFYADRSDVTEELDRLGSHFDQVRGLFSKGSSDGQIGKRLDFLSQEMGREVNTIGSKCADLDATKTVLNMKVALERIREQVQNLE